MKDITRSVLRYTRDILIVLIILVFLARTGNMPVIVPDKVTDFIIDVTSDLFSGRVFSSFSGFLSDIGDFFLTGGTDRDNRRKLELYRKRVEQYFDRSRRNLLYLAAHPDIRRCLPDYQSTFSGMYAKAMLENTVKECFDVDRMSVYSHRGIEITTAVRKGVTHTLPADLVRQMALEVKKRRHVLVRFTKRGGILFATSFSSRYREKYGMLVMELNNRGILALLNDASKSKNYHYYCADSGGRFYADSAPGSPIGRAYSKSLKSGKRNLSLVMEERFVKIGGESRRTYLFQLKIGRESSPLWIGLLGPDGNILSFVLLMLRLILLVGVIWLLLFLLRRILQLSRQIFRDRILSRKLLEVSLEKSLQAGSRVEEAAEKAVDTARKASEAIGRGAGMLRNTPVTVSREVVRQEPDEVAEADIPQPVKEPVAKPSEPEKNPAAPEKPAMEEPELPEPDTLLSLDPEDYNG